MWLEEYENKFSSYGQTTILLQSVEKPVVYNFTPKGPSDGLLHRGAYGLYFAGIFISLYGVYLMMNDKTKKCSHWFVMVILLHVWRCCISLIVTWCVFFQVDFRVGHFHCREKCSPFQGLFKSLRYQLVQGVSCCFSKYCNVIDLVCHGTSCYAIVEKFYTIFNATT